MARGEATDFLQSFRFHVIATAPGADPNKFLSSADINDGSGQLNEQPQAGFSAINTPSGTIDVAEYREGQYLYTRKYPGIPTMDDVTMSRGVALTDTDFFFWFTTAIEGTGEYRADLTIRHFHRGDPDVDEFLKGEPRTSIGSGNRNAGEAVNLNTTVRKDYILHDAFPTAHKVATDLDSTASEVSIMDLTVAYERFSVIPGVIGG
jgi:phage tail-like protein